MLKKGKILKKALNSHTIKFPGLNSVMLLLFCMILKKSVRLYALPTYMENGKYNEKFCFYYCTHEHIYKMIIKVFPRDVTFIHNKRKKTHIQILSA